MLTVSLKALEASYRNMDRCCLLKKHVSIVFDVQIRCDLMKLLSIFWGSQNVECSQNRSGYVTVYTRLLSDTILTEIGK